MDPLILSRPPRKRANLGGSSDETIAFNTSCSGTDESGIVLVRVLPHTWDATCDDYRLAINVH